MKGTRALVMIVVSLLIGALAVVVAARWVSKQAAVATTDVVVAASDIQLGSPLGEGVLKVVKWPDNSRPEGYVSDIAQLQGRVANTTILRGEPVLESRLAPVGTKGGLAAIINPGNRAITVKVNEVIGVAGFALPGSYVDILVNAQDDNGRPFSKIVLERILVLAVAQEADRDETKPKVVNAVTLEVSPNQAEVLDLARGVGQLSLVLRNQIDQNSASTDGARMIDLLRGAKAEPLPPPPPAPAPAVVEEAPKPKPEPKKVAKKPAPTPPAPPRDQVEVIKGVQKSDIGL